MTRNPKDDPLPTAALFAGVDYLVSGDQHLLGMEEHKGVKVIAPRALVEILDRESE